MAKKGTEDPRWIVENKPDGANVNEYHWSEKNVLSKCKSTLADIINQNDYNEKDLLTNNIHIKFLPDETTVDGEAFINNRKGKTFFTCELEIHLSFKADLQGANLEGQVYVEDFTEDRTETPQINIVAGGGELFHRVINTATINVLRQFLTKMMSETNPKHENEKIIDNSKEETKKKNNLKQNNNNQTKNVNQTLPRGFFEKKTKTNNNNTNQNTRKIQKRKLSKNNENKSLKKGFFDNKKQKEEEEIEESNLGNVLFYSVVGVCTVGAAVFGSQYISVSAIDEKISSTVSGFMKK